MLQLESCPCMLTPHLCFQLLRYLMLNSFTVAAFLFLALMCWTQWVWLIATVFTPRAHSHHPKNQICHCCHCQGHLEHINHSHLCHCQNHSHLCHYQSNSEFLRVSINAYHLCWLDATSTDLSNNGKGKSTFLLCYKEIP